VIIAQISDPHIVESDGISNRSDVNAARLGDAVHHLMRLPARPDVVLVSGDCTQNGYPSEYERFRNLLSPLTMPVYVLPGNHDDRTQMLAAFGDQGGAGLAGFVQYVVDEWPVRLIGLDTHVPGQGGGELCGERLEWLERRLSEAPERPTLLFMHHPPFLTGLAPFDQIGLAGADALSAIIARHRQVELIVAGHVHATMARRFHGTLAITCSSTAYQLLPDFGKPQRLEVIMEPPACLLHVWAATTGLITHTSLIGDHGPVVEMHDGQRWLM
jgi:3',5'-cyclic-AMP phosphodiesterase